MKKALWLIIGVLVLTLTVYLARHRILRAIGGFLVVEDELRESDVIVVLVGSPERMREAIRLVKDDRADRIIISGSTPASRGYITNILTEEAQHLGIALPDIIWEEESRHTFEHPLYVKPILKEHNFRSAIILSSPYHMRRSAMLFDRVFREEDITLTYRYVRDSGFDPDHWWRDSGMRRQVGSEYLKLAVNFWGTRVNRFVASRTTGAGRDE